MKERAQMKELKIDWISVDNSLTSKSITSLSKGANRTIKVLIQGNRVTQWDPLANLTPDNHDIHKTLSIPGVSQEFLEVRVQRNQASPGKGSQRPIPMRGPILEWRTKAALEQLKIL